MSIFQSLKQSSYYFISICRMSSKWNSANEIQVYQWKRNFRINKTRCYFPRPSETMRIKKHGWETRMSTPGGRKVLMNRILKGRHVLSH